MSKVYKSFDQVYQDLKEGVFSNEAELRQAFVEALKNEFSNSSCNKYIVEHWFVPVLDETVKRGRPEIMISNIVIEVEPPRARLKKGLEQLYQYMEELYQSVKGEIKIIYGLVTDGEEAELLEYDGSNYRKIQHDKMPTVIRNLINLFCSSKIPIIRADDILKLFGV